MELKLDGDAAASIAAAAIFESLSQEHRETVLKQSIQYLLAPTKSNVYPYTSETPLQGAFNEALRTAAYKVVREQLIDSPEIKQAILDVLGPLIQGALEGEAADFRSGLADTIGSAIGQWLNEQARKE